MKDYPDLPEIMAAGFGLTEALALWSQFQNSPGKTADDARFYLREARAELHLQQTQEQHALSQASPNVIQFSRPRER